MPGGGVIRSWRVLRSTAPPNGAARPRCYRPRAELVTLPLTPSVAPSFSRARCPVSTGSQTRFHRRLVKAAGFFESERLPSTNAPLPEPATVLTASPPRGGFRNPFAPGAPGFPDGPEARPDASPRGPGSVRRLLQPKMIREHALRILRSLGGIRAVARALTLQVVSRPRSPQVRRSGASRRDSSRGFSGQGPRIGFRLPSFSRRDCS